MTGYGVPSAPAPAPTAVRAGTALLGLGAAATLLTGLAAIPAAVGLAGEIASDTDTESAQELSLKILAATACLVIVHAAVALAAGFAVRAVLRRSRTGHWYAVGISFGLAGLALLGYVYGWLPHLLDAAAETGDLDWITTHLPYWYGPVTVVGNLSSLALCTCAGLLLVLPASVDHASRRPVDGAGGTGFEVPR